MKSKFTTTMATIAITASCIAVPAYAGWGDYLGGLLKDGEAKPSQPSATSTVTSALSTQDMNGAILDALSVGVQRAIKLLGQQGGFLNDAKVRIPMPENLQKVESVLRGFGQDKYADRFITSMNSAAEQSVPKTTQIFLDTIKGMSLTDAKKLLNGPDDAATSYFREKTSGQLEQVINPIVSKTMDDVGVTKSYKKLVSKADFAGGYIDKDSLDLDAFVTRKTMDGLFLKLAEEEAKIRKDPVARSTDLLKKVFSQFSL